ncbi:hypothetical protein E4U21_002850 [Claviceps maximensis]|nr:hypothetical protein E4U21_002850 [Claviceps maximensis]
MSKLWKSYANSYIRKRMQDVGASISSGKGVDVSQLNLEDDFPYEMFAQELMREMSVDDFVVIPDLFDVVFVVDDVRLGCERQYNDVADAVNQFMAKYLNRPANTGIDLYFMCNKSGFASQNRRKYDGGFYNLQQDTVRRVLDDRKSHYAETVPAQNRTVFNIIDHYIERNSAKFRSKIFLKPLLLITISGDVPWAEADNLKILARRLDQLRARSLQVFVYAIQIMKGECRVEPKQLPGDEDVVMMEVEVVEEQERLQKQNTMEWDQLQEKLNPRVAPPSRYMVKVLRRDETRPDTLPLTVEDMRDMILAHANLYFERNPGLTFADVMPMF